MKKFYLNPLFISICTFILLLGTYVTVDKHLYEMITRTYKVSNYNEKSIIIYSLLCISFILGISITLILNNRNNNRIKYNYVEWEKDWIRLLQKLTTVTLILTSIGSIVWIMGLFIKVGSISKMIYLLIEAKPIELRQYRLFIPGITTLTQVGPVCVTLAYIVYYNSDDVKIKRRMMAYIFIIIIYSLFRVRLNYERLALLDICIPLFVIFSHYSESYKKTVVYGIILVISVYLLFTFGEYFKSWQYYKDIVDTNIFVYSFYRLVSYYWTSINNAIYLIVFRLGISVPFFFTFEWIWKFPIIKDVINYERIFNTNPYIFSSEILNSFPLNPEYNVYSTAGYAYWDFGFFGGCVIMIILGCITAAIYKSFSKKSVIGTILYPVWYTGLLEFYRIQYWGGARQFATYAIAIYCILIILFNFKRRGYYLKA